MENREINLNAVAEVAAALKELKSEMVFVGGAVVSLYTEDPAAEEIRPTQDIDLTLKIFNLGHWEKVQEKLAVLGFHPDPHGHALCSYTYKGIAVDIMASEDSPLGPANRWYKIGFESLVLAQVKDQEISILSAPCFLATKFEAFNDRGSDYRTSHDMEDIFHVLDSHNAIVEETKKSDRRIKAFLAAQFEKMQSGGMLEEVLMAHIHPLTLAERRPMIIDKINQIIQD